ncbi:MAG TPA: hypothetical protein DCR14_13260 [Acidimicrobiaceae bacterium]|nr:hypothetical protein [Acidimicrobiaceae bacterium]
MVIAVLVVAALIGGGLALLLGGDDDPSTESVDTVGTTTAASAGEPTTTVSITTTSPTVAETTAVPTESEFFGPGASLVVSDPLPSGLSMDRADDALPFAQLFADRLAEGNWVGINRMLSDIPATDAELEASFGGIDRLSLIVVDASDDGFAVTLQLIGVANEADATTTIRCFRWSVSPDGLSSGGVYEAAIIDQLDYQATPESVFEDTTLMSTYAAGCVLA